MDKLWTSKWRSSANGPEQDVWLVLDGVALHVKGVDAQNRGVSESILALRIVVFKVGVRTLLGGLKPRARGVASEWDMPTWNLALSFPGCKSH